MKRLWLLVFLLLFSTVSAQSMQEGWERNLENGYITTAPVVIEEKVILRTSGTWDGEDRPGVYALSLKDGSILWEIHNQNAIHHDMAPILYVESGQGCNSTHEEMLIIGWSDGRITALNIADGTTIWTAQSEKITWGVTGGMALDEGKVVVPTRQGLSALCLENGEQALRVELAELGWRNGVSITQEGYFLGNEEGILNFVTRSGGVEKTNLDGGKLRHPPIPTSSGILTHLQKEGSSSILLDGELLFEAGPSPAIPVANGDLVHLATSSEFMTLDCSDNCTIRQNIPFHSNGELALNGEEIWAPRNTPEGGWGVFTSNGLERIVTSSHDTYTTAAPGFGQNGEIVLGSDSGWVELIGKSDEENDHRITFAWCLFALTLIFGLPAIIQREPALAKISLTLLLITTILAAPDLSKAWSSEVAELEPAKKDWNDDWPEEWKEGQVVVFELEDEIAIYLEGHDNVLSATQAAAQKEGISLEIEQTDLGPYLTAIATQEGAGWEYRIDGKRGMLAIDDAKVGQTSVIRWFPA